LVWRLVILTDIFWFTESFHTCTEVVTSVLCPYCTTFRGEETLIKARKVLSVTRVVYYVYGKFFLHVLVQSSGNTYIKSTKKSYWVMNGLYITDISVLHLISLYSWVIWVCIDVIHIADFVGSRWEYFLSEQSVYFNSYNQGNCC